MPWPERVTWNIWECSGEVGRWIGIVEAETPEGAITLASERYGYKPSNLLVIRRR
jgi:hypothetical protein